MKKYTLFPKLILSIGLIASFSFSNGIFAQTTHVVGVTSNVFTPKNITISVGDTVLWNCTSGRHNVNGMKSSYPNNADSFGNEVGRDWTYSHVFTEVGVNDYQCDPHVGLGMIGSVTVTERVQTLTVRFSGMTPHLDEMLTLYLKDLDSGVYVDTVVLDRIIAADFELESTGIEEGKSYHVDFFADHNGNGVYDAPPTDHSWRLELLVVDGDETLDFAHNTNFTDLFGTSGVGEFDLATFRVYPNPVTDVLYLENVKLRDSQLLLTLVNITGKEVLRKVIDTNTLNESIDLRNESPGIYFLSLIDIDRGKKVIRKLIKK